MIVQSVHYPFAPDGADEAGALSRELREASRKETGVVPFEIARSLARHRDGVTAVSI
jgi:quinol monooxygenase YgiN